MAEVGAVVVNFVATTRDFEKSTQRVQNQVKGFGAEASTAASAVASAFGMSSPAIAAFTAFTRQVDRARAAQIALSKAMIAGGAFAAIGIGIGAVASNVQSINEAIGETNKLMDENNIGGPRLSFWNELGASLGIVNERLTSFTIAAESAADARKRMDEQNKRAAQLEDSFLSPIEMQAKSVEKAEKELAKAVRDRKPIIAPSQQAEIKRLFDVENQLAAAVERAQPWDVITPKAYDEAVKKRREYMDAISRGPRAQNVEESALQRIVDAERRKLETLKIERSTELAESYQKEEDAINASTDAILGKMMSESERISKQIYDNEIQLMVMADEGNTAMISALERQGMALRSAYDKAVITEFYDELKSLEKQLADDEKENEKAKESALQKEMEKLSLTNAMNSRSFQRPEAVQFGSVADYRAGLSNQDALFNTQKNIEGLNRRMADSLKNMEAELKFSAIGI